MGLHEGHPSRVVCHELTGKLRIVTVIQEFEDKYIVPGFRRSEITEPFFFVFEKQFLPVIQSLWGDLILIANFYNRIGSVEISKENGEHIEDTVSGIRDNKRDKEGVSRATG